MGLEKKISANSFIFLEGGPKYYTINNALGLWLDFVSPLWRLFPYECEVQKTEHPTNAVSTNLERNRILTYFKNKQEVSLASGLW